MSTLQLFRRHRKPLGGALAALMAFWQVGQPLQAADFYWDETAAGTNNVDGTSLGGSGTWDTTATNWWNLASNLAWPNSLNDTAIFTGPFVSGAPTLNTVTVSAGINANRLSFLRSGYTLSGGDITLGGTNPGLNANLGESATISSQLLGSGGLTMTGGGSIRLTNATNGYTGATTIANGSLIISDPAALGGTGTVLIRATNNTPLNNNLIGFGGGSLVLDGTAGGFTFARDIDFEGRGPIGDRGAAILSLGNNTLSGTLRSAISPLPLSPTASIRNSRINSVNGTLTLTGTLNAGGTSATTFTNLGGVNQAGVGNFSFGGTGVLTGTGTIEKSGGGTLFLNSLGSNSGFTGTVRVGGSATGQQSSVLVTDLLVNGVPGTNVFGGNAGTNANATVDMNGGVLEIRSDASLNFAKQVYGRGSSTIFVGNGIGGTGVNGTATFGAFRLAANNTQTFNSRNGYGVTLGAWTQESSSNNSTIANGMSGTLTFTGDAWNNADGSARNLTFSGNGNTRIVGSITATGTNKQVIKQGTGELILNGVGGTFTGNTSIEAGAVRITDFRSINNVGTASISLGNAGTTAGNLIIGGTGVGTGTVAGLTSAKPIILNTTTVSPSIYANQSGSNPVVLGGAITRTAQTTGGLILGGTNTADNIINVAIPAGGTTGGLTKLGAGTWVLNAANAYPGATNILNGTLKLRATAAASDVIPSATANTVVFNNNTVTGSAGGTLEFRGFSGAATTETLGALTPTAGAATVRLLGNGAAANLIFTSLGATAAASSLNFDTSAASGGTISFTTAPTAATATTLPGTANFQGHLYLNGSNFADVVAGVVTAPTYGGAGNFRDAGPALVAATHNRLTSATATAANTTISSLLTNNQTLTLGGNLVVSTGGILQSGGTASILSDSATARLIQGGAATTNVAIRVDGVTDVLDLGSATNPVNISNVTTGGLTKNGAGTLNIFGTNAQTGATTINEGTIRLNGAAARLTAAAGTALVVRQGATLDLSTGVTSANAVVTSVDGAGTISGISGLTFTQNGGGTWNGVYSGTGFNITKTGGNATWSGLSTYTGVTTIGGTGLVTVDTLADGGAAGGSGIGSSTNAASNLVFTGSTAGIDYRGSIIDNALTLGSRSASTDRLFTLAAAATGAVLSSTVSNNNAIVWSNTGAIVNNTTTNAVLTLTGTSAGDNILNPQLVDSSVGGGITLGVTKTGTGIWKLGNSSNTYTGATTISQGILQATDGTSLPTASNLVLDGGALYSQGTFNRNFGTGAGEMRFATTANTAQFSGFVGGDSKLTVAFNGNPVWDTTASFLTERDGLILNGSSGRGVGGSTSNALSEVEITGDFSLGTAANAGASALAFTPANNSNQVTVASTAGYAVGQPFTGTGIAAGAYITAINSGTVISLSGNSSTSTAQTDGAVIANTFRTIRVDDNGLTGADFATISGVISAGDAVTGLQKVGGGILRLTGANTYGGATSVREGTLTVRSLSGSTGPATSSVGAGGVAMTDANAITLGNGAGGAGVLQYVGAGETSDRKIRLNTTTGSTQIHADGSGPLILTNVANDMAAGAKTLFLRGTNTAGNMISSVLADNGGTTLGVTVDGGASWILTAANTYTGVNTASAGALGIGNDAALGTGGLTNNNGNVFAYGADRTLTNILTLSNNATNGWQGDYSLTFSNPTILAAAGNNVTTTNNIVAGKTLTLNGVTANALTANRAWAIDGAGETVINGNFTTSTAFGVRFDVNGGGTLNLGTNGATSSFNQSIAAVDVDRGTLKFSANNAIPTTTATNGGIIISPEIAVNDTATVDLNGTTQTINTLTATTDGAVVIDNTSGTAATFRFGANDTAVNINPATTGARTITDSGAGVLNLVKLGTTTTTFNSGMTLTYQGTTAAEAGTFTINSDLAGSTGLIASGASTLTLNGALTTASGNISLSATGNSTLALTGGISNPNLINSITVGAGSTLNLLDGAGSLISNLTSLNLGNSGAGTATLNLNIGDSATDTLTLLTMGTLNLGNTITFNMTDVGLSPLTTYTLLNLTDGGLSAFGLGNVIQGATPGGFSGFTWNVTDNLVQITTGTLITGQSFWRGATNNTWNGNVNNWSTDKAGSISAVSAPGQGTDVVFAYDGVGAGPLTTTLGQNFKVNSLTFEAGTTTPTAVTIAPGAVATNRLEVAPQVATDGVTMTATGPAAVTVSAPFRLGANQDWQVDGAAQTLTLSGALLAAADVTKSGPGRVVLGAAADASFNTGLTADFTVNAGNLELTNAGALGTVANANLATVTVNSGGFYYNNAASGTVANPLTLAGGTLSAGGAAQTYSGTLAVSSASTINMADSNGPVANTARNITLSGVVSGNGSLTIDSNNGTASVTNLIQQNGTLTMNNAGNTWTGDLIFNRGSVTLAAAASPSFTGNNVTINSFGRLSIQGVNAQTLTRTGTLGYGAGAIGELGVDNTSGTLGTNFVVQQNGAVSLGSAGTGASVRVFLADVASALNIGGAVTLGGNSSISVAGGDADSFLTISGIIGDGGSGYGLAINDDAQGWGQATNTIVRLTGANTFSGNVSLDAGVLEFDTVSNVSGAASSLGQGTAITTTNAATLRFVGSSAQSTNRPITTAGGGLTLSANGATAADTITYAGAINVGPTADGTQITLTGAAGRVGIVSGGITQTGDTADMQVTGGTWTHQTGTSRVGDDLTVTGATTIFNLDSGLFQVRDDLTVTAGANLNLNGTGVLSFNTATLSGDASLRANGGGAITLGANNPIVTTEFDGFRLGTDAAGVGTLNMGTFNQNANEFLLGNRNIDRSGVVNGTGVLTVTGNFDIYGGTINANLASTGTGTLDKLSLNTVTLTGDNSGLAATGATVVTEGTLVLDYTNNTATKVRAASALDMRGATLNLVGNAGAAVAQTVGSFTLGSGGSSILNITKAGQDVVLNLGVITRAANSQDGTIRFNLPTDAPSATNGYTTGSLNTIGAGTDAILGGWATVTDSTGTYFARNLTNVAGGNIGIASTTSQNVVGSWVNGQNISDSGSTFSGTVSGSNLNSLRFNNSGGSELTVAQGGVLSLASGGILVTSNAGGTPSILGGTLASSYGTGTPEIIVNQDSAATLEIGSDIRAGHIFFKTGTGTVLLSGQNTYTGLTEIQNGTLQVSGGNAIGDNSLVTLGAGRDSTLQLLADETIGRLNGGSRNQDQELGTVAIGTHTLTVNQSATQTYAGRITGTGSLVMNSGNTGNLNLSNISAGFTGSVVVNGGLLNLTNLGQINASSITINRTGGLLLDNNGGTRSGTRILDTTAITLNSADGAFSGGTVPRGLSIRTDQNANTSETIGDLNFNSGASYVSGEGEASGTGVAVSFITANNFTRANNATFMARGRDLGAASGERNQFRIGTAGNETAFIGTLVGGAGLAGTQNISIVPWAIGAVNSGTNGAVTDNDMGNSFLTYTAGTGLRPLNLTTEYDTIALAAATDNARESLGADLTGLVGTTVNSLILNNTAFAGLDVTGTGAGQTLAVTSGAMLFTVTGGVASTAYDTTLGGFDSGITVGSSNEYVISVVNPSAAATTSTLTATIASPLSSAADITKSGRGTLVLNQVNTAGGGANKTTINEGTLQIADLDNIGGGTGGLVFAGGALRLGTGFTDDLSTRTISFLLGGGTLDTNGNDAALANSLGSGAGAFTKIGAGNLTLNATSTRTGATTLTTGTITIGANDALGVGGNLTIGAGTTLALGTNGISQGLVTTSGASPQITGTGTVTASAGFFLNHTGNTAIGAVLAGAGGLLKAQTNTVTLSGLNTYTGTTEIQAGILSFNTIGNVGGGASALGAPTSVENGIIRTGLGATSATLTYTGAGSTSDRIIEMQGTTGGLTINADGTGALALGRVQTVVNGAKTLTLQGTSAGSLANSIAGIVEVGSALSVTKAGANTWVINGANTYTGTTTAGAGTLRAGSSGAFGTSAVTLINTGSILELANGVNVGNALTVSNTGDNKVFGLQDTATSGEYSGTITIQETTAGNFDVSAGTGGTLTLSGVISGAVAGGVSKVGLGTVVLAGTAANTYTGVTGVTNGELQLNKTAGVNAIAGAINVSGGTLRWLANNQVADTASITQSAGAVNLNGRTETLTSYTKTGGTFRTGIGGKLTLTGTTFTFNGTGDNIIDAEASIEDAHLVVTNGATVQVFGANNSSYDPGPYGTSGGTLQLNAAGAGLEFTAGTNAINLDSDTSTTNVGKLLLKGNVSTSGTGAATIASVGAGAVSGLVDLDAGTRTFTIGGTNPLTVNAPITNGGLTKAGAGAMTLANAAGNTYDLGTTVSAGTLLVNNATGSGTGTGSVTVNTGATLGGSGIIAPTVNNASVSVQGLLNVGNAGDTTGADLVIDMSGATGTLVVDLTGGVTLDYFSGQGSGVLNTGLSFNDQLGIVGGGATLNLGGDLTFNNFNGLATNTFTAGSSWKLFAWSGVTTTGSFSNITGTIGNFSGFTDLSTELLGWDFSRLYDFGEVSIVVIPEPSRAMLLLLGLLGLGFRRRRTGFLS